MKFFSSPYLIKDRDVLVVVCDRCHIIASQFVDGIPLCPGHAAQQINVAELLPLETTEIEVFGEKWRKPIFKKP